MYILLHVFLTVFSIGLIALIFIISVIFFIQKKDIIKSNNGIFLIDVDLKNNRLRKSDIIEIIDKEVVKNYNHEFFDDGWMDISQFLSNLSNENKELFLNALDAIKVNKKYVKFTVKNKTTKDPNYYFEWIVEFFQTKDSVNATIKWSYVKELPDGLRIITKEKLFENTQKYKSFIAFNLRTKDQTTFKDFIIILFKSLKIKNLDFFISKNIVILILYGDNSEETQKRINKIMKKFEKIKVSSNLISYCNAIGVVESKNLFDTKDLLKIINRIYFSIIKSTQLKKTFYFNAKNIFFNEFEEFKENYLLLNNIIKDKVIKFSKMSIMDYKNNTAIATYIKPEPKYPENFWINMIIENDNILPNIEDEYFNNALSSFKNMDQYLIDVNDYVILQNVDKLQKLSGIIFVVKFLESTDVPNFELITSTLKSKGIKFGIRIDEIGPSTITLIESIMPHAIIISESLIDSTDLRKFLKLKQLIMLCNKNPATLIFENPSKFELINNKINYFYEK